MAFVEALTWRLRQRRDYELVQAWMAVFLRVHGGEIAGGTGQGGMNEDGEGYGEGEELREALREWRAVQDGEGKRLGALVGYCSGVLAFLRSER